MKADAGVLESRYRRLLRLYPAAYRHDRGEEMLDTLMQLARPGQRRPNLREATSLALGALRIRTGAGRDRGTARSWRGVHRLAVLYLLAAAAADPLLETVRLLQSLIISRGGLHDPVELGPPVVLVVISGALLTAAAGRKRWALGLCLAATVAVQWWYSWVDPWQVVLRGTPSLLLLAIAAVLLAALPTGYLVRTDRRWTWLLAVPVMVLAMPSTNGVLTVDHPGWHPWFWYGSLLAFLLWTLVDPRVPLAITTVTATIPVTIAISLPGNPRGVGPIIPFLAYLLAPLGPLLVGALRMVRTARL